MRGEGEKIKEERKLELCFGNGSTTYEYGVATRNLLIRNAPEERLIINIERCCI